MPSHPLLRSNPAPIPWATASLLLAVLGIAACDPVRPDGPGPTPDAAVPVDGQVPLPDASVPGDALVPLVQDKVYAHSPTTLFEVDPNTLAVTVVGDFVWPNGGSDQMTDIALDEEGAMVGMSFDSVYAVDKTTAVCTFLSYFTSGNFNGMSWVEGVGADPQGKTLVGVNLAGDYASIDPQTGAETRIGGYGGALVSSGDLVYVRDAGVFATATDGTHATDVLVSVNAGTGVATLIGETGFSEIWGLAYWGGTLFGFTNAGQFLTIDPETGHGTLVETTAHPFWGAGVTIVAPIVD